MLDEFLSVAYTTQTRQQAEYEMVGLLKDLPDLELRKIAGGTAISDMYGHLDREKRAMSDSYAGCAPDGEPKTFLDRFKGSPLFEQAMQLEQQELEAEMMDIQQRLQERAEEKNRPRLWDIKDQIRLKKRLLELQLVKQDAGAGGAPPADPAAAQGAGAPGEVPAEGVQDNAMGVQGSKTASAVSPRAMQLVTFADTLGRAMARSDLEKAASAERIVTTGKTAGSLLAKHALNLGAFAPMATKAMGWAAKNPQLAGAALGAGAGALAAPPGGRLSGALGGAGLGMTAGSLAAPAMAARGAGAASSLAKPMASAAGAVNRAHPSVLGPPALGQAAPALTPPSLSSLPTRGRGLFG